jgi:uncharacterized membrane protein (UPF0127 family)
MLPLAGPEGMLTIARSRAVIARHVEIAATRATRRKGLLSRTSLAPDAALLLAPCFAVHTAFMRFSIDVVFVDREGCVRRIVRSLAPWRIAASPRAYATIEFAAGVLDGHDLVVGDRLCLGARLSMPCAIAATT